MRTSSPSAPATVFYSWQSDIKAAACRSLLEKALEGAAKAIAKDGTICVEPAIDRDTQDVPGSPDIGATIFGKIKAAAVFVADVTIVNREPRMAPNPNVLVELGYALGTLGWDRILMVQNLAFGRVEDLPFDLRQKRVITYTSPEDATERATERRSLQGSLERALRSILAIAPPPSEFGLTLGSERRSKGVAAETFEFVVRLRNGTKRRIEDWALELEFPTPLIDGTVYGARDDKRSTPERSYFVQSGTRISRPLRPGEEHVLSIGYRVTPEVWRNRQDLLDRTVRAAGLIDGQVVAEQESPIRALQDFSSPSK